MAQRPMFRHPWRVVVVVGGLVAVLNLGVWIALEQDSSEPGGEALPRDVQRVTPEPGDTTGLVTDVQADLRDGLTGVLVIDRLCVPEDQLDVEPSQGIVAFRPGPGKDLRRFDPGQHTVVVVYRKTTDPEPDNPCTDPQEGAFRWSFRATS